MKKTIFIVLIAIAFSCKNEVKKVQDDIIQKEDTKKLEDSKPKTLEELLYESFEGGNDVNKSLGGLFNISKASIVLDPKSDDNIYVALLLDKELTEKELENYELQLNIFPYDEELSLLRSDTKEKKRNYDSWYFKPKFMNTKAVSILYKKLDTPISDFKQIYIHLYDVNQKVIIQESIVIKEIALN